MPSDMDTRKMPSFHLYQCEYQPTPEIELGLGMSLTKNNYIYVTMPRMRNEIFKGFDLLSLYRVSPKKETLKG